MEVERGKIFKKKKSKIQQDLTKIRHNQNALWNCTWELDCNIRIESYLCPACRQSWYYPPHFLTPCSYQWLPLRLTSKQKCQVHTVTYAKQQAVSLHDSAQNTSTRHLWLQLEIQFIVMVIQHYRFLWLNLNKAHLSECSRKNRNPVSWKSEYSLSSLKMLPYAGMRASVKHVEVTFPPFWSGMWRSMHEMNN